MAYPIGGTLEQSLYFQPFWDTAL